MPYRFDVTEGEKKVFGHACDWAETRLPELAEAGRSIDEKISGMVGDGHENRPGYLLVAVALNYADSLIGDPGAGFDAMLAAEGTAAAKRAILLAWLLIAEDSSAGAKITPLAVLPWPPYKGRWLAQSTAFRDRTATWTKPVSQSTEIIDPLEQSFGGSTPHAMRSREVDM